LSLKVYSYAVAKVIPVLMEHKLLLPCSLKPVTAPSLETHGPSLHPKTHLHTILLFHHIPQAVIILDIC